jgi:cysteine desulfurase family protein (TIGR01976 family)
VIDAVSHSLAHANANCHGAFATSRENDNMLQAARLGLADLLGADDPAAVCFGLNMTSLTFSLSRALAKTWRRGDEVIVTRLDHDANVRPWALAARDAGASVRFVGIRHQDGTLDTDDLRAKLSPRTRLVAVACASNATGSVNPVRDICTWSHEAGALVFLDAVHFAPHALMDVQFWECDFLACSAYKFFGPHVAILWGRRKLLEELSAYKVRPAPNSPPEKWMTGTQNHEGIAGALAAVDYLADLGRAVAGREAMERREALRTAFSAISRYERALAARLLTELPRRSNVTVRGITDPQRLDQRLPTVSITHAEKKPVELAEQLGERGFFVWHGNYYAVELTEALGLEPAGMLRIGLAHYNTLDEVDRFLEVMERL